MGKAVYSLVLSEDVIAAIDRLAYQNNTNRSGLINRILAEYVSYTTPEKRMQDIFARMEKMLVGQDTFQLLLQPSDTMFSLRSALTYKYNPTVRYSVELYKTPENGIGELRVSLRTQNRTLLYAVADFFRLWASVESACIGDCSYALEEGRFRRLLVLRRTHGQGNPDIAGETLADLLSAYIEAFDDALKAYFACIPDREAAGAAVRTRYMQYLAKQTVLV